MKTRNEHAHRFHTPHKHLNSAFGNDWFALKAEAFARFFGTPVFLIAQTVIVGIWILINVMGWANFDVYPFILLNLAFSLQAAYAAPLILLAQTRQADRDKVNAEADAEHREEIAQLTAQNIAQLSELIKQNTKLTEMTEQLSRKIESMTSELHAKSCGEKT
ncbi:MAG: DUF1003 domain-containing protein [Pseudobdellovibrio sp.]